jgi:nucleotide-binding universal stress UspA family protein
MYDHVLVAVDGSDPSTAAVREAVVVAEACEARLSVLHVIEPSAARRQGIDPDATPDERRVATAVLRPAEAAASSASVPVDTEVRVGRPAAVIADRAGEADLLVTGTHGRTGLRRVVLGSVAERLVRTAPVPVLTTRDRPAGAVGPYRDVLLPVDGSGAGRAVADRELAVADAVGARVHVLYVVDRRLLSNDVGVGPARPDDLDRLRARGERATAAVADLAADRGIPATTAVVEGIPRSRILAYVDDHDVDLVAMGTHARAGTSRWLSESVATATVRAAPVPVLTVRYDDGDG